jgi:hypothetical protein
MALGFFNTPFPSGNYKTGRGGREEQGFKEPPGPFYPKAYGAMFPPAVMGQKAREGTRSPQEGKDKKTAKHHKPESRFFPAAFLKYTDHRPQDSVWGKFTQLEPCSLP